MVATNTANSGDDATPPLPSKLRADVTAFSRPAAELESRDDRYCANARTARSSGAVASVSLISEIVEVNLFWARYLYIHII